MPETHKSFKMTRLWVLVLLVVIGQQTKLASAIQHRTNLIWAQSPRFKIGSLASVSRLVAVHGDPAKWVANMKPEVDYISAPHPAWELKALGFHWNDQTIYWSEAAHKKIQSLVLNGSTDTLTLFAGTSSEVSGIAVDWLSRNLYFTDALYNWIMMISSKPKKPAYRIVVQDRLDSPHGIAVHPQKGYLFWSDWGARPRIEVSNLLGGDRRILAEREMIKPRGLTIDYTNNCLYWVDGVTSTLEVVQFNGEGRKVINKKEGSSYYGIALYQDFLFLTERNKGQISVFEHNKSVVSFNLGNIPYDIIMYDASQQQGNSSDCSELGCEHMCVLDPLTGPKCICGEGFIPGDNTSITCKPSMKFVHPTHIYAIRNSICQYPANLPDMSLENVTLDNQCFLKDSQGYMTLTFDFRDNMLYYFGNNTNTISRLPLEMGGKATVLAGGLGIVNGMTLDWVAGNLYWTETDKGIIKVAKKSGAYQSTVLQDLVKPWGIVVHPGRGKIYWSDHGSLPGVDASIQSANLDGTGQEVVMSDNVGQPNHLFIDFEKDYLYWTDSMLNHVRRCDLDTGRITVILQQRDTKFYGLSIFKDFIIWTDTDDLNGIHVARMDKRSKVRGIIHPNVGMAADLITFDIQNQPDIINSCSPTTTKCSQLCLVSSDNNQVCRCGTGYELSGDGYTCTSTPVMDEFILVNDAYQKQIFQVNLLNGVVSAINLKPYHQPTALGFDPNEYTIFWSDNKAKVIKQASINGKYEKTVLYLNENSICDGLVADYVNKLLFYTDTGNDIIGVVSMRNYSLYKPLITVNLDQPRDIVVSPHKGKIYWSDWGANARIEKSNMDGSERETVINFEGTAYPNGLTLDTVDGMLFWVDAFSDAISSFNLTSGAIKVLAGQIDTHYFSIDVIGSYLYVTDWRKNYLQRMRKNGGELKQFGEAKFTRMYGIKGYNSTERYTGISVCVSSPCDQLCLPKVNNGYTCTCAIGFIADGPWCRRDTRSTTSSTESTTTSSKTSSSFTTKSSTTTSSTTYTTRKTSNPLTISTTKLPSTKILNTTFQTKTPTKVTTKTPSTKSKDSHSNTIYFTTSTPSTSMSLSSSSSNQWNVDTSSVTIISKPMTTATSRHSKTSTINHVLTTASPRPSIPPKGKPNASASRQQEDDNSSLATGHLIAIVLAVVISIVIVGITIFFIKRRRCRRYFPSTKHEKLIEEKNPADFYKIAFQTGGDDVSVTFDSGIENPTFEALNNPEGILGTGSNPTS